MARTRPPRLRRRLALVLLGGALLGTALGSAYSALEPREYTAQTVLRVAVIRGGASSISGPLSRAYADAADSDAVLEAAIARIGTDRPAAELKAGTRVTALDSGLVEIAVTSPGRGTGAALANSITKQLAAAVPAEAAAVARNRSVQVEAVLAATRPVDPDDSLTALRSLTGGVAGLVVGALVALLMDAAGRLRSRRLRRVRDVERLTRCPVLGSVPVSDLRRSHASDALAAGTGPLLSALEPRLRAVRAHVVLVTSTRRGEGRTSLVAALGAAMSSEGRSVLAVDMDLQRPHLAQAFGLPDQQGMADVLRASAALQDVAVVHSSGCVVVTAGRSSSEDAVPAGSTAVDESFRRFRAEVDTVLVDGPPLGRSRGMLPLTRVVDSALVVVTLGRTRDTELTALLDALETSGITPVGIALETRARRAATSRAARTAGRAVTPAFRAPLDRADFPPPAP